MNKEISPAVRSKSKWWIWLIAGVLLVCLILVCCLAAGAGAFWLWNKSKPGILNPGLPALPPQLPDLTAIPFPIPTEFLALPTGLAEWMLIADAEPMFGSTQLERGFSPDPFTAPAQAGGMVNTAYLGMDCGFTSPSPTYKFRLGGGASDTFLRIFFVADDGTDTTLVLLTPDQEWLCVDDSSYGSKLDPVIDLEFAPSGEYVLWVGIRYESESVPGTIFVTQSMENTP